MSRQIADLLREVAAKSDKITGKYLKSIENAANNGQCSLMIEIDKYAFDYINSGYKYKHSPLFLLRFTELGFEVTHIHKGDGFFGENYYATVAW